jgi:hypothetical protein
LTKYITRISKTNPLQTEPFIARTKADVLFASKSKYWSIALNEPCMAFLEKRAIIVLVDLLKYGSNLSGECSLNNSFSKWRRNKNMIHGSKKMATSVLPAKTVLQLIPVPEIGFNFKQPRVAREIDAMLETGRYVPVIIATENVPIHDVKQFFKNKSFDDPRVKMYRVPNLVGKSLQEFSRSNLLNRVSYVIFNGLSQLLYLLFMIFTLFIATIKEHAVIIHVHNPPDLTGIAAIVFLSLQGSLMFLKSMIQLPYFILKIWVCLKTLLCISF